MKSKLLLFVIIVFHFSSFSQPVFYQKTFGSSKNDFSRSVKQMQDGSLFIAGFSDNTLRNDFDVTLTKLNEYGNVLWTKYYGDTLSEFGFNLIIANDGKLIVCGEMYSLNNGTDAFMMKLDTAGNLLWNKIYSTPLNESVKSVIQTADGGFALCGFQNNPSFSNDAYVIKTDALGNLIWDRTYDNGNNDVADRIIEPDDNEFLLVIDMKQRGREDYDIQLMKLDSLGLPVWERIYGDSATDGCQGILKTHDNKYFFYGESGQPFNFILVLTDSLGNTEWIRYLGSNKSDAAFSAVEDDHGDFILTGYSNGYNEDGRNDLVVFKVNRGGTMEWLRSYGDAGIDIGYEIIPNRNDDGYYIAGKTFNMLNQNEDYYLLHVDRLGGFTAIHEENKTDQTIIFPNPANDVVQLKSTTPFVWELLSMQGEIISTATSIQESSKIETQNIPSGIYLVKLLHQNHLIEYKKLAITH